MTVCKHYKNITPEKLANLLNKANLNLCQNPIHGSTSDNTSQSQDLWFCLTCGFVGCDRSSPLTCSLKHYEKIPQHSLFINPVSLDIWCYQCDNSVDEMIEAAENKNKGEVDKLTQFRDKITQLFFKVSKELKKNKAPGTTVIKKEEMEPPTETTKTAVDASTIRTIFGLKNIGNTCFFNSVMQCLNATQPLTNIYLDLKNFDVSDLKGDDENNAPMASNDDWITVAKPKHAKGGGGGKGKGQKGKNNPHQPVKQSSFVNMSKSFQDFLIEARGRKNQVHDPSGLFSAVSSLFSRFRGYSQQDAQELLRNFLDALTVCEEKRFSAADLAQSRKGYKHRLTETEKVFGCYLCNYVKCQDCSYVNRTFDFCLDIVLNIYKEKPVKFVEPKKKKKGNAEPVEPPQEKPETNEESKHEESKGEETQDTENNVVKYKQIDSAELKGAVIPYFDSNLYDLYEPNIDELMKSYGPKEQLESNDWITVEDALKEFTSIEMLNKTKNFYRCEHCEKEKRVSTGSARRFYIYDPPPVLTLVLKRYRQIGIGKFEKVNTQVKFGETLNLDPFVLLPIKKSESDEIETVNKPRFEYDLYGIVVQSGNLNGGHYVSYTKHEVNGEEVWFYHSDTSFKAIKKASALASQPYILFYKLRKQT